MPQQYPQVVSPVSLTPPMKTRRGRPMDAQDGASSNTTGTTISTTGSSHNNSPKNRRARRNASPTRPVPAKRSTLDSWFLRDSLTPASVRSEGSRSPLRSLSPDAPVVGKTGRVYGVGRVPSPENGRKGRVVELSGSPSSSLSSRVPTSGSAAVATVTPPGLKSSCGGGDVRSLTDLSTTPPPRGNRLARRSRRRTVSASFEQGSSRALTGSPEGNTISASTSRRRSSKRCPTSAPVPAISGGSAKIKSDPAKGRDTFTRSAKAPRTSTAANDSANPKRSTNIQAGSFPTARTEGEASAKNLVMATPDDPLAPSASPAAEPGPRGRPAKKRASLFGSTPPPCTSGHAAHDSANPKRSTNIQAGSFPTARTEGEASAKNLVTTTPDNPLAPSASPAADPGPRGRPAKKRASLFGSTPPPCTSGPAVRSPRNVCHVSTVTGCSGVSSCASGVPVVEKMRHDGHASSGKPALARTPSSKAAAPRKRKSIAKPTVRRSGPLVVGAGGGMGWKKKDTSDEMKKVGAKLKGKLGQPSASSMPSTKGIGDGAASAGEAFEVGAPAGENGSVQAFGMRPTVTGIGVAGRENEDVPPKKRKVAASLDEEQYVTKETCRARSAGGEGTSKSDGGDDAGVALAGDPRRLEAAPLGAATLTEAGTRDVFDAPLLPVATASAGTTSASASQSTLADSPTVTPLGRAALPLTGVPSTTSHIEGEQKILERLGRSVTAAVDSRGWTPPGTAGETVAMASKAPPMEGEGQAETHIMAGQGKSNRSLMELLVCLRATAPKAAQKS